MQGKGLRAYMWGLVKWNITEYRLEYMFKYPEKAS